MRFFLETDDRPRAAARRPRRHWLLLTAAVAGICLAVYLRTFGSFGSSPAGVEAETMPRLRLQPLADAGQPVTLDDLAGRVVLLHFWGTWCRPCRIDLSYIADLERRFRDRTDVRVLAVSCGRGTSEDLGELDYETRIFFQQANIDMPVYADPGQVTRRAVAEAVGFDDYPTTVVLDRRGRIRRMWRGPQPESEPQMRGLLEQLLQEK
jgi:cytochrome c biogenesis protein CcmG, thiol:disulfide interchange protein DsbE